MHPDKPHLTSLPALLLLLLLVRLLQPAQAHALHPAVRAACKADAAYSAARLAAACSATRTAVQNRLHSALARARHCLYNGLPYAEYAIHRDACRDRSEARQAVERCAPTCSHPVRARLQRALAACIAAGWTGSRPSCPRLQPIKSRLAALAAASPCPKAPKLPPLRAARAAAIEKARIALGIALSPYSVTEIEPEDARANAVLVALHGFGGNADQLLPLATMLGLPRTRIILPQALVQPNTLFNRSAPSWFDVLGNDADSPQATDQVIAAANNIAAIVEVQTRILGVKPGRVLLAGFSQGAALALTVYLRNAVGAVVAISGYVPIVDTYPAALNIASQASPILMFHGTEDLLVPLSVAEISRDALVALGRKITLVVFEGEGHELTSKIREVAAGTQALFLRVLSEHN